MSGLRVLVTNTALDARAGSELYVRDLTTALLARGHTPIAYSPVLGEVAREIRVATVPVVDDLAALGSPPDVIHGHHCLETLTALLRFPGVPAISMCHGWLPWQEVPPRSPRIRRYVAVDDTCRDRLVLEHGIPQDRVRVLRNFVDLDRFRPRGPLPARPTRALVFSNAAAEHTHLAAVREACAHAGITVDVAGSATGRVAQAPEDVLTTYDLVFAKGRAALEALAVGAAVVLCDAVGAGPLVTDADFDRLRALNFGIRALSTPVTAAHLARELARYDAADTARVSLRVRREAGRDVVVDELIAIYHDAIAEQAAAAQPDLVVEARAAADTLRALWGVFQQTEAATRHHWTHAFDDERARLCADTAALRSELERQTSAGITLRHELDGERVRVAALTAHLAEAHGQLARMGDEFARVREELAILNASTTVRLRDRILSTPGVRSIARFGLRVAKGV